MPCVFKEVGGLAATLQAAQESGVPRCQHDASLCILPLNAPQHVPPLPAGGSAPSAGCASGHEPLQSQRNITDVFTGRKIRYDLAGDGVKN